MYYFKRKPVDVILAFLLSSIPWDYQQMQALVEQERNNWEAGRTMILRKYKRKSKIVSDPRIAVAKVTPYIGCICDLLSYLLSLVVQSVCVYLFAANYEWQSRDCLKRQKDKSIRLYFLHWFCFSLTLTRINLPAFQHGVKVLWRTDSYLVERHKMI